MTGNRRAAGVSVAPVARGGAFAVAVALQCLVLQWAGGGFPGPKDGLGGPPAALGLERVIFAYQINKPAGHI